jgi:hypothetical protein
MNTEERNKTNTPMVAVSTDGLLRLYMDFCYLYWMLDDLIALRGQEEKLREHHRPYLDVREKMGQMCEQYQRKLTEIGQHPFYIGWKKFRQDTPKEYDEKELLSAFLEDILILAEYVDAMSQFMHLMESGVKFGDSASQLTKSARKHTEEILNRWECLVESEVLDEQ